MKRVSRAGEIGSVKAVIVQKKRAFHINGYNRFITIIIDYKRVVYGFGAYCNPKSIIKRARERETHTE
jgi:hypothetical protein